MIKQLVTSVGMIAAFACLVHAASAETPTPDQPSPTTVADAVRAASRIAGVSAKTLLAQLAHESAFRHDARNAASSAAGPAQFLEGTWLDMIRRHGAAAGLASEAAQITTINGRPDIADPAVKTRVLGGAGRRHPARGRQGQSAAVPGRHGQAARGRGLPGGAAPGAARRGRAGGRAGAAITARTRWRPGRRAAAHRLGQKKTAGGKPSAVE